MSTKIQLRRDTQSNWTTANPTLLRGELGYETDTRKFKIGDGNTAWNSLDYCFIPVDTIMAAIATETTNRIAGDNSTLTSANAYTDTKVSSLVNSAPAVLDTLKELADALGSDPNFATTVSNQIGTVASDLAAETTARQNADTALQNSKEPNITPGTDAQYWRGDKTFQNLTTSVVTEGSNLYYTDSRVASYVTSQKGISNGLATLGANTKLPIAQAPTAAAIDITTSTVNAEGTSSNLARADHTHHVTVLNYGVSATNTITSTSLTDVLMNDMTITPPAGTYMASFSASVVNSGNGAQRLFASIYVNGVQVTGSERVIGVAGGANTCISTQCFLTIDSSQAVEVRWRAAAGTNTAYGRSLLLVKLT